MKHPISVSIKPAAAHDRDCTDGVVKELGYILGLMRLYSDGIQFGQLGASNRAIGDGRGP
jgi:hypothetical protein